MNCSVALMFSTPVLAKLGHRQRKHSDRRPDACVPAVVQATFLLFNLQLQLRPSSLNLDLRRG